MAGQGGLPKLSFAQQDNALSVLMPALLSGERLLEKTGGDSPHENADVETIRHELSQCVLDIRLLIQDIEEAHTRQSTLDVGEMEFIIEFLKAEVKYLESRMRTVLSLNKVRSRGVL
jgi:hypothetical protein